MLRSKPFFGFSSPCDGASLPASSPGSDCMPPKSMPSIAVAVDWEVLPRSSWHTELNGGARVEVVTAVQGG